jgi:hypothetical protein
MCERKCPKCQSTEHFEGFGMVGAYIVCDECGQLLAQRRDQAAAHTDLTEEQAEQWANDGSGVLIGAEAENPADDEFWGSNRFEITTWSAPRSEQPLSDAGGGLSVELLGQG